MSEIPIGGRAHTLIPVTLLTVAILGFVGFSVWNATRSAYVNDQLLKDAPEVAVTVPVENVPADAPYLPNIIYENDDHVFYSPTLETEGCPQVERMAKESNRTEVIAGLYDCRGFLVESPAEILPLFINTYMYYYHSDDRSTDVIEVVDLNTLEKYVVFTPRPGESLFAGDFGDYGIASNDIEYIGDLRYRVGVYKYYADPQDPTMPRDEYGGRSPEKIRDEIIDLNELRARVVVISS